MSAAEDADADDETATLEHTVSGYDAVTGAEDVDVTVIDNEPAVTVSLGKGSYTVAESDDTSTPDDKENEVTVKVVLSADPERTVIILIDKTNQDDASSADYSDLPDSVTFNSGETEKTFTFTATHDTVDDDGESVKLTFGTLPTRVSEGDTNEETVVSITDDDHPEVTVSFEKSSYTVAESDDSSTMNVEENKTTVKVVSAQTPSAPSPYPSTRPTRTGRRTRTTAACRKASPSTVGRRRRASRSRPPTTPWTTMARASSSPSGHRCQPASPSPTPMKRRW